MENNNDFLPSAYVAPAKSNGSYMKLLKGENRIRILSKPIIGWLDWDNKKPLRFKFNEKPSKPIDPSKPIKHFWAFVIWDCVENKIKIMEITQSGIQQSIQALTKDADWGSPFEYDIKIIRAGDGMETTYTINPVPHKPVYDAVKDLFKRTYIDLEQLFVGGDPFASPIGINSKQSDPF